MNPKISKTVVAAIISMFLSGCCYFVPCHPGSGIIGNVQDASGKPIYTATVSLFGDQKNVGDNGCFMFRAAIECEQIFFNQPIFVKRDKTHSINENRYYALGRTNMNRLLFAVFTVRADKIRIISARDMTDAEKERYLK